MKTTNFKKYRNKETGEIYKVETSEKKDWVYFHFRSKTKPRKIMLPAEFLKEKFEEVSNDKH